MKNKIKLNPENTTKWGKVKTAMAQLRIDGIDMFGNKVKERIEAVKAETQKTEAEIEKAKSKIRTKDVLIRVGNEREEARRKAIQIAKEQEAKSNHYGITETSQAEVDACIAKWGK